MPTNTPTRSTSHSPAPTLDRDNLIANRTTWQVAGPMTFNALPDDLRDSSVSTATFGQSLKTHFVLCLSARLAHLGYLFHDLLRLPILHHYVWSELTGHNSLQRQRSAGIVFTHGLRALIFFFFFCPYRLTIDGTRNTLGGEMMARIFFTIMQSLVEIEHRTSVWGDKVWWFSLSRWRPSTVSVTWVSECRV